jgi:hypothetical protein
MKEKTENLKKEIEQSACLVLRINNIYDGVHWNDLKSGNFETEGNPVVEKELLIRLANIVDVAQNLLLELEK